MKLTLPRHEILGPEEFNILSGRVICHAIEQVTIDLYTGPAPVWYDKRNTVMQNNLLFKLQVEQKIKAICIDRCISLWNTRRVIMKLSGFIDKLTKSNKRITIQA